MGEERGERSDETDLEHSRTEESTGDGGLEPTGGPRRVVSEESVDDVVASLEETKTTESNTEIETGTDRTDANANASAEPASDGSTAPPSPEDVTSTSPSPSASADGSTTGVVDLDDLSDDAGPLAGRLQADTGTDLVRTDLGSNLSVEPDSTTNAGDASVELGVDERDRDRDSGSDSDSACDCDPDRAAGSPRADDPDGASSDAPDDDAHSPGLLARIKRFVFD